MEPSEIAALLAVGLGAGVASGLLGVGGGIVFVPGLVIVLEHPQLDASATSLLAVVVVAAAGAWRQQGYGNLRMRDGAIVGLLSPLGVAVGTVVANSVPERALELGFAALQLYFAYRLVLRWAGRDRGAVAVGEGT